MMNDFRNYSENHEIRERRGGRAAAGYACSVVADATWSAET
jgi:hypothetical protein